MSKAKQGMYVGSLHPMFGKTHSEKSKLKMSKSKIGMFLGEKSYIYGKHLTDETKEKLSKSHLKNHNAIRRSVIQLSLNGTYINEYESIREAKKSTGAVHISDCCSGKRKTANNFEWMYKEDYDLILKTGEGA